MGICGAETGKCLCEWGKHRNPKPEENNSGKSITIKTIEKESNKIESSQNSEILQPYHYVPDIYRNRNQPEYTPTKIVVKININITKLKEFLNTTIYQGKQEKTNDYAYDELIKYEEDQLKKQIDYLKGEFEKQINEIINNNMIRINDSLVESIFQAEFTTSMLKRKIKDKAQIYENDKEKHRINNLRILLVGRKKIGKTDLINYILELDPKENDNKNQRGDTQEFTSERVPFLNLIEYKGIGFNKDSNIEKIGNSITNYISELKNNSHDKFIHCIWYCITETRFGDLEINLLRKLKTSYGNDNKLPIIVVYTKTETNKIANEMEQHIKSQNIDTKFVKTLAQSFELPNGKIKDAFGKQELLNVTLEKCTESLQGDLIGLMTNDIAEEIKKDMLGKNQWIFNKIGENLVDNFIKDFNMVKDDGDFLDYIINTIMENLKLLKENNILNKTFNLINRSDFINDIKSKIEIYKSKVKPMIKYTIETYSKILLDQQVIIEKEKGNMEIKNKRKLKDFERTTEIFMKKNLYYIAQRMMISYLIEKVYVDFFKEIGKKLNEKTRNILNIDVNKDIKKILEHTFKVKLKDFGKRWNIEIKNLNLEEEKYDFPEKNDVEDDQVRDKNNKLITNSFNYITDYKNEEERDIIPNNIKNWFPFNRNRIWKYLKDDKNYLEQFLQSLYIQDNYFNKETYDQIFVDFREYMKNVLVKFLNEKKMKFMEDIDNVYKKKEFPYEEEIIPKITELENVSSIYDIQIEKEIDLLNNNINEIHIEYMTILVVGRSGVGKSKLINEMLTEEVAGNCVGPRGTVNNDGDYRGKNNFKFLRFIDTMGAEPDDKLSLNEIVKNVHNTIGKMKQEAKKVIGISKDKNEKEKDFNRNIQCIYYCVRGSSLEDDEIKAIENIKNNKESIPVIIVYTMALNKKEIEEMRNLIETKLKLPFISILVVKTEDQESYGMDKLLVLTLDICQQAKKGNVYKAIKELISQKVKLNLMKENKSIKDVISGNMLKRFTDFKNVVQDAELYQIIYDLMEIAFIEYMNIEKKDSMQLNEQSMEKIRHLKELKNYIKDFIEFYNNKSIELIEKVLEKFSLDFLDMQVKKEKKNSKSIEIENKSNRDNLKKIIKNFLKANFFYISQKYLVYRFFYDFSEPFCEGLEKAINDIIVKNLEKSKVENLIEKSFDIIFNNFRKYIYKNSNNGKIYNDDENNDYNNNDYYNNKNIDLSPRAKENENEDLPSPYPSLENNNN